MQRNVDVTPLSTSEYVQKEAMVQIVAKANAIIEAEAPISYDRLVKRSLDHLTSEDLAY